MDNVRAYVVPLSTSAAILLTTIIYIATCSTTFIWAVAAASVSALSAAQHACSGLDEVVIHWLIWLLCPALAVGWPFVHWICDIAFLAVSGVVTFVRPMRVVGVVGESGICLCMLAAVLFAGDTRRDWLDAIRVLIYVSAWIALDRWAPDVGRRTAFGWILFVSPIALLAVPVMALTVYRRHQRKRRLSDGESFPMTVVEPVPAKRKKPKKSQWPNDYQRANDNEFRI
jgi:hypothetical protein